MDDRSSDIVAMKIIILHRSSNPDVLAVEMWKVSGAAVALALCWLAVWDICWTDFNKASATEGVGYVADIPFEGLTRLSVVLIIVLIADPRSTRFLLAGQLNPKSQRVSSVGRPGEK